MANVFLGVPFPAALPSDWCLEERRGIWVEALKLGAHGIFVHQTYSDLKREKKGTGFRISGHLTPPHLNITFGSSYTSILSIPKLISLNHFKYLKCWSVDWVPFSNSPRPNPNLAPPKPSQLQSLSEDLLDTRLVFFFQATHPFEKTYIYI